MRRLRLGILGTGNIANQFCAGLSASSRAEPVAVGSRTESSAKTFAARFRIPRAHGSYDALLADRDVEAIYLSLPNSMHHEWTIKALRAGKDVLCEKPLAVSVAEAQEMFDVARSRGKLLVEAFMYVSHPQTQEILRRVRSGEVGQLRLIRGNFCYRTNRIDGNIRFDRSLAGGAMMDVGCYCTHFARTMVGAEPTAVHAVATMHPSGVDVATSGVLKFPNDVLATFSCGMSTQCDNTSHVCGTDGYFEIPWPWKPQRSASYTLAHSAPPKQDKGAGGPPPRQTFTVEASGELYELEANDFAASVLDSAAPRITEADSIGNMRVIEQIRKQIGL